MDISGQIIPLKPTTGRADTTKPERVISVMILLETSINYNFNFCQIDRRWPIGRFTYALI